MPEPNICSQSITVMGIDGPPGPRSVAFTNTDPADPDHGSWLALERDLWESMGRPSHITITIRPGDELNAGGAAA